MLLMPTFATKLNHLLTARGLTQADLREAIGKTVSNGTVSHWCSGKSLPRLDEAYNETPARPGAWEGRAHLRRLDGLHRQYASLASRRGGSGGGSCGTGAASRGGAGRGGS